MNTDQLERLKKDAAEYAVRKYIHSNMTIGLGTGSTMHYFIEKLGALHRQGKVVGLACLSTSEATSAHARQCGVPILAYGDLLSSARLDIAVDGADNVNRKRQLIKGGGGALTREKIIAYNSNQLVIIADSNKYAPLFSADTIIPLEVLEIAHQAVRRVLLNMRRCNRPLFGSVEVRGNGDTHAERSPAHKTDNGNVIVDAQLQMGMRDARRLERALNTIPGVVENGLFTKTGTHVILASPAGIRHLA